MPVKQQIDLQWDLSSGRAKPGELVLEIPLVAGPTWGAVIGESHFPYVYTDGEQAEFEIDIWGLDRRMALIWAHYLRPADWWLQFGVFIGGPRPAPTQEINVYATPLVKAKQSIEEVGVYPSDTWVNGGNGMRDGLELVSGATGVRLHFSVTFHGASAWELVGQLVLKPDQVFGCEGLGQKVADRYTAVIPPAAAPTDFHLDES